MKTPLELIKGTIDIMNQVFIGLGDDTDYDSYGTMMYNGSLEEYHISFKRIGSSITLYTNGSGIVQTYTTLTRNMYLDNYTFTYHEDSKINNIIMKYQGERAFSILESKFIDMDKDTKFQYGLLYPDFDLYHEAYCYLLEKSIRVYMTSEDLEKYRAVIIHDLKERNRD